MKLSILQSAFAAISHVLHHGPSMKPFWEAQIAEHDSLEARVAELEKNKAIDDEIRAKYLEAKAFSESMKSPQYISPPVEITPAEPEPVAPSAEVPPVPVLDPESPEFPPAAPAAPEAPAADQLPVGDTNTPAAPAETNAADPAITPIPDLLAAQPDPVSAAPDTAAPADAAPAPTSDAPAPAAE